MTIEPISTVMTAQAQTVTPKVNPIPSSDSTSVESATTAQAAEMVDKTTKAVEDTQNKGENNQGMHQEQTDSEQLKKAVEQLNKKMANSEAVYGIHEGTNRVTIKLVDKDTKEVIKELPPEKTLDMIAKAWEMAGILVDEKR